MAKFRWTEELILQDSQKYSSKGEWCKRSPSAYHAAKRLNLFDKATSHMVKPEIHNKKWTKELVLKEAKKYITRKDWQNSSGGSWLAAYRGGYMSEASSHMKSHRSICQAEQEILELVRNYYPRAKTSRFANLSDKFSFKRMEIDVFIPELNKGIEFDGAYWHRPEIMRLGRPKWKEEEIQNYSSVKDLFFKDKGIELLHITENTWNSSKDQCTHAILMFIEVKK